MLFLQVSAHYHPSPVAPEAGPPARYGVYPRGAAVRMYGSNAQVIANGQVVASGVALMATGALTDCSSALPARKA